MTTASAAAAGRASTMTRLLKHTALLVALCCAVWLAAAWHWRSSGQTPSDDELLRTLLVLPLLVFGCVLLLRWAWRSAAAKAPIAVAGATSAGAAAASAAVQDQPDARDARPLQLLAAHLCCAAGASAPELLQAAHAHQPLPRLDPELRNADGLPVMSHRIAGLPLDELTDSPLLADAGDPPPEHVRRALAALHAPLAAALQALAPWRERFADPDHDHGGHHDPIAARAAAAWGLQDADALVASSLPPGDATRWPRLQVLLAWPADWTDADRTRAETWARELCGAAPVDPSQMHVHSVTLAGAELWQEVERRLRQRDPATAAAPLLVAAAHSDLGDDAVAALERQHRLFDAARHPKGLMPCESAAALLLAPSDWPVRDAQSPPQLLRAAALRRDKSIEAAGSVSSQALLDVLAGALGLAGIAAAELTQLVCDADRHSQRGTELFGATLKALPQLDPAEQVAMTGGVAGHGGAGVLMVIAAAAAQAQARALPCLALALGDTHWRLALVARPAPAAAA